MIIYSARKWARKALAGNPTVLLVLFVLDEEVVFRSAAGAQLTDNADRFVSRLAATRFLGYLRAQKAAMTGAARVHTNRPELDAVHGYDSKYAMHALRLGLQGVELLNTGRITLPVAEPHRGYLRTTTRHSPETASRPMFASPKTSASFRVIPLPATVTAALRAHLRACPPGPDGLLFTTPTGNVLNPANWRQRTWRPLVRSAPGIPAGTTFHRRRHAYASLRGDAGLPDHDVQLRLGHAHPGEVRWYRHPYPGPGDGQATRDATGTALTATETRNVATSQGLL